jgi:hypothetical protein
MRQFVVTTAFVMLALVLATAALTKTVMGTAGNDSLRGTRGADLISGKGGNDTLRGLGGNDRLLGGAGNDRLNGDAGNDVIMAGPGNDTIATGPGSDQRRPQLQPRLFDHGGLPANPQHQRPIRRRQRLRNSAVARLLRRDAM